MFVCRNVRKKISVGWSFSFFFLSVCVCESLLFSKSKKHSSFNIHTFHIFMFTHVFHVPLNGCRMGPWVVLISPCFRENVVVACKLGLFCVVLKIKFQNGTHLIKGLFLTYFSHFLVTREKLQKFLQHRSHSHTYMHFAHPIDLFCLNQF